MDADSSYGGSDTAQDSSHFDSSPMDTSHHLDTSSHMNTSHHMDASHHNDASHHMNPSHHKESSHHNPHSHIHTDSNHHTKVMVSQENPSNDKVITALKDGSSEPVNHQFYHKNEITLPVNYEEGNKDEIDFQREHIGSKEPHYMSTAKINVSDCPDTHSNLEEMSKNFRSTTNLNAENPECDGKYEGGIENPAFVNDASGVKSTFNREKPYNGDLNTSLGN